MFSSFYKAVEVKDENNSYIFLQEKFPPVLNKAKSDSFKNNNIQCTYWQNQKFV